MRIFSSERRLNLGISLSATKIHAVPLDRARRLVPGAAVWSCPLEDSLGAPSGAGLTAAMHALRQEFGRPFRAWIALLPPLAQLRWVDLPPLSVEEERRLLARDATRYFLGARSPQCVGVVRDTDTGAARTVAVAASAALLDYLDTAVLGAGGEVGCVVPAAMAWAAAARRLWSEDRPTTRILAVSEAGSLHILQVRRGQLAGPRRIPYSACETSQVRNLIGEDPGRIVIVAKRSERESLYDIFQAAGAELDNRGEADPILESPAALAASFAAFAKGPELIPDPTRHEMRKRSRRRTAVLSAFAALALVCAAGIEAWGAQRELRHLQARRLSIRAEVEQVAGAREMLEEVNARLAALVELESGAPRWSQAIGELAEHLPRDAHLTSLRARGDTLRIEGAAGDASGVFAALRKAGSLGGVAADAPIRRELRDGAPAFERFVGIAQLPMLHADPEGTP